MFELASARRALKNVELLRLYEIALRKTQNIGQEIGELLLQVHPASGNRPSPNKMSSCVRRHYFRLQKNIEPLDLAMNAPYILPASFSPRSPPGSQQRKH